MFDPVNDAKYFPKVYKPWVKYPRPRYKRIKDVRKGGFQK